MDPLAQTALAVPNDFMDRISSGLSILRDHGKKVQKYVWKNRRFDVVKKINKSLVNVVLVEARNLPEYPAGGANAIYCKFKLGTESHKSKQISMTKLSWREQFKMNLYDDNSCLEVTVWHKGKQKNFMGRCIIDLSTLEKEKTHEMWQVLECGHGSLHLLITLNPIARPAILDNIPSNIICLPQTKPTEENNNWCQLSSYWNRVGQLHVKVQRAKGLSPSVMTMSGLIVSGVVPKPTTYVVLELDNSRIQTSNARAEIPEWDKNFVLDVSDITSTLTVTVYNESYLDPQGEFLGMVTIPLLRIKNNEEKWYALKDKNNKTYAKGSCPRVLLKMSLLWNPITATARVLTPKEIKYTQKKPKFNIPLLYSNLKFIGDIFQAIESGNEQFKMLFEWENRETSFLALAVWMCFWFVCRLWMIPILIMLPFSFQWFNRIKNNKDSHSFHDFSESTLSTASLSRIHEDEEEKEKDTSSRTSIKMKLVSLQDLTFTIKNGIDYIVSLVERIKNLFKFVVPYLSYVALLALLAVAIALFLIPVNYLFMAFGIYKFTRKILDPNRVPNNDILDFLSRIPDDEMLKQWKELKVPEPETTTIMNPMAGADLNNKRNAIQN